MRTGACVVQAPVFRPAGKASDLNIFVQKKEGNRPRSGVCADGAADVGEEKARAAVRFFDHLFQLQGGFFVIGMADADRLLLQIVAALAHQLDHAFQHFFSPAPFFERNKRPVFDMEKRFDVEQAPKAAAVLLMRPPRAR